MWVMMWQALGGVGGRCLGLTPAVDVLPDRRYYFNVQLLLYVVFFLYCFWFFQRESKEKLAVSVATRLGGIYNAGQRNHRYQWLDRVLLLGLGGVYTLSVLKNSVTQGYLLVGTPADWRQESGPFGYWYAVCETVPPGIMLVSTQGGRGACACAWAYVCYVLRHCCVSRRCATCCWPRTPSASPCSRDSSSSIHATSSQR